MTLGPPHPQLTFFKNEAAGEYDEIMIEYCSILGKSLTLTEKAYENADKRLKKKDNGNGAETSKS